MKRIRWWGIGMMAVALVGSIWAPLRAQNEVIPPDASVLFDGVMDIDKMRVLNPLKLSADQMDKIAAAIEKSQKEYNSSIREAAVPPIKAISSEIKETRNKMLGGATIPKEFDDKVKKLQDEFIDKRTKAEFNTLKGLSDTIKEILFEEQRKMVVDMAKKFLSGEGKPKVKGEDDKFFNFFVLQVFINYPRAAPLLREMKAAKGKSESSP